MKKTIYLSKSMRSNPHIVTMVRNNLKETGHTIVEHRGEHYDPNLPPSADLLIMIPPDGHGLNSNYSGVYIGKGQYQEYVNFLKSWENAKFICVLKNNKFNFRYVLDCEIEDIDWQTKYAKLMCSKSTKKEHDFYTDTLGINKQYFANGLLEHVTDKTKPILATNLL